MPVFDVGKDVGDIQEGELLPEDWYTMEITSVSQEPNKALKEGGQTAEGAGFNIEIEMKTLHENEMLAGRPYKVWLALPREGDAENRTKRGNTIEDFKIGQIRDYFEAFAKRSMAGSTVDFATGMQASMYIVVSIGQESKLPFNEFSRQHQPRAIEGGGAKALP